METACCNTKLNTRSPRGKSRYPASRVKEEDTAFLRLEYGTGVGRPNTVTATIDLSWVNPT